jgi:NADH:ubiquinone oxidoreductase subunit 2 (subunit N)
MVNFDNLNIQDAIFILLGTFIITIIVCVFLPQKRTSFENITNMIEVYFILLILVLLGYAGLKESSNNATILTQDKLFKGFVILILAIVLYFSFQEVVAQRNQKNGFLLFVVCLFLAVIILFMILSYGLITQKYEANELGQISFTDTRYR